MTPWHHDQPYWYVSGKAERQLLDRWTVAEATSLRVHSRVASLGGGVILPVSNGTKLYEHTRFSTLPDIDAHEDEYDIVSWRRWSRGPR
ncbi:hypothetical protein MJ579_13240 [Klebsiella pneumoniae]|nr:hypothetical protein MJ579_13240 [Klebsiella pneumoniae]